MKAIYEKISSAEDQSFRYIALSLPHFNAPFHYHPELELTLIEKSAGKRFIGGQVAHYEAGDLVLLGPNVPHCWINAEAESPKTELSEVEPVAIDAAQAIVIQFDAHFLGESFLALPELNAVQQLIQKIQTGLLVHGETRNKVAQKMRDGLSLKGFPKLLHLLDVLYNLAISDETELIEFSYASTVLSAGDTERFQRIFNYLIDNFRDNISLEEIARVANLSPTAFCRYFKKVTRKTFVDVLTEFRIKHACQLLSSTEKSVKEICFDSGFGNVSYFNKEFKKALGQSPLQYRNSY